MKLSLVLPVLFVVFIPLSAYALEGQGPRVSVTGIVKEVRLTEKQKFDQYGGEFIVEATNGQIVTVIVTKDTQMTAEGRMSRKYLIPENIVEGMQVRVRGWRLDSKSLNASLFVIMNIELNPVLSGNGVIQSFGDSKLTVLSPDGVSRVLDVTNETEVNVNYTVRGVDGLNFIGKQALFTTNPNNSSQIRILSITGLPESTRTLKPTTVDLKKR